MPSKQGLNRRSVRMQGYDYACMGADFLTICTHQRLCLLGEIVEDAVSLTTIGTIVEHEWRKTPEVRGNVVLDAFVVMPNHLHGVIMFTSTMQPITAPDSSTGVLECGATGSFRSPSHTIGAVVRGFKAASTKRVNITRDMPGVPVWQRNYYEHVIRDEAELNRVRQYIEGNPARWAEDEENVQGRAIVGIHNLAKSSLINSPH